MKDLRVQVNKKKGVSVNLEVQLDEGESVSSISAEIPGQIESIALRCATAVAEELIEEEVLELCGARYEHDATREATRYGRQPGSIAIAGRKVKIDKPRVRRTDGGGEVELKSYQQLKREGTIGETVIKSAIRGVSSRNYEGVVVASCEGFGMKKSSVSREFIKASAKKVKELCERRFDETRFVIILIDGVHYAGVTMLVAMGVTIKGEKVILGLKQGASENARVCTDLLESITDRGVSSDQPALFVLDGAKALKTAVLRVFGKYAVIQRCRFHKRENIKSYIPKRNWDELSWRLNQAFDDSDYGSAHMKLRNIEKWLEKINPDAAASMREGMEELLTVTKLEVPRSLRKSINTTNMIESVLSIVRDNTQRVSSWKNGDMRLRWCATALLNAETRMALLQGKKHLPKLAQAMASITMNLPLDSDKEAA